MATYMYITVNIGSDQNLLSGRGYQVPTGVVTPQELSGARSLHDALAALGKDGWHVVTSWPTSFGTTLLFEKEVASAS
jgi:hypothetical protein